MTPKTQAAIEALKREPHRLRAQNFDRAWNAAIDAVLALLASGGESIQPGAAFQYTNSNALGLVHFVGINPHTGGIVVTNDSASDKHLREVAGWEHLDRRPELDIAAPASFNGYLLNVPAPNDGERKTDRLQTREEMEATLEQLRHRDQRPTYTVWKNGGYKLWSAIDAEYAAKDPDFLCNIPAGEYKEVPLPLDDLPEGWTAGAWDESKHILIERVDDAERGRALSALANIETAIEALEHAHEEHAGDVLYKPETIAEWFETIRRLLGS